MLALDSESQHSNAQQHIEKDKQSACGTILPGGMEYEILLETIDKSPGGLYFLLDLVSKIR